MEIIQHEQQKHNILLTSDYCPNQAMINEFQTIFTYGCGGSSCVKGAEGFYHR